MSSDPADRASRTAPVAAEAAAVADAEQRFSVCEESGRDDDTPTEMSDASLPGPQGALSERDRRILALEGRTFRYVGAKERAIREQIGLSKVAYFVRLNALLDEPEALRAAPSVVNRLRARRTSEDGPAGADGTHRVA